MATAKQKKEQEFWACGKRKTAIARVRLSSGKGDFVINSKTLNDYFGRSSLQYAILEPLKITATQDKFNIRANIVGGGTSAQAIALQHGISRALITMNPELRKPLKQAGFLTRDSREKERRKVGRRKARRSPQYSKR